MVQINLFLVLFSAMFNRSLLLFSVFVSVLLGASNDYLDPKGCVYRPGRGQGACEADMTGNGGPGRWHTAREYLYC